MEYATSGGVEAQWAGGVVAGGVPPHVYPAAGQRGAGVTTPPPELRPLPTGEGGPHGAGRRHLCPRLGGARVPPAGGGIWERRTGLSCLRVQPVCLLA